MRIHGFRDAFRRGSSPPGAAVAVAALLVAALATPSPASPSPDPIEGKWAGEAGSPLDRIELGLEFKRNSAGELKAYLYEPVCNFYGLELPGKVERKDSTYTIHDYATTLTLRGDALEGTYLPTNAPATLHRTRTLPAEVPIPPLPAGPGPKWQARVGIGPIYAPAAVREGVVYVGTTGGTFDAVRESDGSLVWMFAAGGPIFGGALVTDTHVFFVCDNGYLFKLDRKTGKESWRYDLGGERAPRILPHPIVDTVEPRIGEFDFEMTSPRPQLADGVLYVGSGDGSFHAIDAETGKRVWRFEAPENKEPPEVLPWDPEGSNKIRTDAVVDGPRVVFGSFGHRLRALDRKSGAEIWQKNLQAEISSSPVLVDGKIVLGSRGGMLYAFDPETGKVLWRMIFWGSAVESSAAPAEGSLFCIGASDLRRVSMIDARDGRVVWRTDVFGLPWARPAVAGKRVFASATGFEPYQMRHVGSFSALDAETGRILWRFTLPPTRSEISGFGAPPVVDGSLVFVGGLDGNLYAFPAE